MLLRLIFQWIKNYIKGCFTNFTFYCPLLPNVSTAPIEGAIQEDGVSASTGETPAFESRTSPDGPGYVQPTGMVLVQPKKFPHDQVKDSEAEDAIQKLVNRVRELEELFCEAHRDCDMKSKVCQTEAEENHQKAVETIDQLETEKSNLKDKAKVLRDMVQDIQNLLSMAKWEYDDRKRECEQEQKAYSILQTENKEMKKTLILQEELLKGCQAEPEENHKEAMGTIDQLEAEKSKLTDKAKMMRDIVQDMGNLLSMTNGECSNRTSECEQERDVYSILQAENEEMKKALIHQEELMKVCQAEAEENHKKAVETIDQLGAEKSDLTDKVKRLRDIVQDMGNLLSMTKRECDDRTSECEREWEAYSILQAENKEMKKALIHQKELMKVCQAEAEENHKKAVETIDQLEAEKSDLTDKVKTLRDIVQDMGNLLSTTNREFDDLTSECEREREAYSILQAENEEMKKTLIHQEELMKVCQAEVEENHKKAMETIDQLEAEKSKLISEAKMLRDIVQDMENLLSMTNGECDDRRNECEREAHRVLQAKCNEMKKRGGALKI